ncbi:hypothetical protein ABT144_05800 [Streptomyces sp. NPDC002039]|uniref:hypothetical protein n=1 Tax=Streptomyces sp. NPDC002039 TaxID=3154660 RepID=UPI0033321DC0
MSVSAEVWPLLAERGRPVSPGVRLWFPADAIGHLGAGGQIRVIAGTEIRVRRQAVGHEDRDEFADQMLGFIVMGVLMERRQGDVKETMEPADNAPGRRSGPRHSAGTSSTSSGVTHCVI